MNQPGDVHPLPEAKNSGGVELEDQWFEVYRISVWSVRIEVAGSDLRCPVLSPPLVCELPGPRTDTRHFKTADRGARSARRRFCPQLFPSAPRSRREAEFPGRIRGDLPPSAWLQKFAYLKSPFPKDHAVVRLAQK